MTAKLCEVVMLVMEMIYLDVKVLERLSPTEDCSMVSKSIYHAAEAIAAYSSTNSNMLHIIIVHYAMNLMLHERQERVSNSLSRRVTTMAFMVLLKWGVISSTLGTAGCLSSQQCIMSLQQRSAMR